MHRLLLIIGIDTNIEVIVALLTTWEAPHRPRAGNGLVAAGNKPLYEIMLTQIYVVIWRP